MRALQSTCLLNPIFGINDWRRFQFLRVCSEKTFDFGVDQGSVENPDGLDRSKMNVILPTCSTVGSDVELGRRAALFELITHWVEDLTAGRISTSLIRSKQDRICIKFCVVTVVGSHQM